MIFKRLATVALLSSLLFSTYSLCAVAIIYDPIRSYSSRLAYKKRSDSGTKADSVVGESNFEENEQIGYLELEETE